MRKEHAWAVLCALVLTIILTLLSGIPVVKQADLAVSDALYQQPAASDGEIIIVGIDQKALEAYGPYSRWGRDRMAQVLETLNHSESCRPAVIGIDVLYSGQTDSEGSRKLAKAAGRYDNVVAACAAEIGTSLVEYKGEYALHPFMVTAFDEPYQELKEQVSLGHINAMLDADGILRHHLLAINLPDKRQVPSLALAVARAYKGEEISLPPVDSHGFWYLPFCGTPGDFAEISVADVLTGKSSPDDFDGKVVLIGPYAAGLQDGYMTAADHASPMYGVEYQANAIQALLWGTYKQEVPALIQSLILFLILLISLVILKQCGVRTGVLLWAAFCGGWLLLCVGACQAGWLLHVLWVPVGVTVSYCGCLAVNYVQEALERKQITNTFRRYVAPEIVEALLKDKKAALELGGKLTEIAVLFVDVRGFTSMSEGLGAELVVEILNQYLTLVSGCILKNGGTLDKFVGDAAMAFWGAPLPQEDYVMLAVKAAWDMKEGSKALSEALEKQYQKKVSFGIGIHIGEAVVGNIGSPRRMDYTAIGDTVNTASRLESNAPGGTIFISREVADKLEGRIRATSLGSSIKLKGKTEEVEVLVLDGIL